MPDAFGAEQQDGFAVPAAPSSARNILPGEPFELAPSRAQAPHSADPFGSGPGWGGGPGLPGDPAGLSSLGFEPATGPLPVIPGPSAPVAGDPLDALQQYAGVPAPGVPNGYAPGVAPAPDPTDRYQFQNSATSGYPATTGYGMPEPSGFADGGMFTGEPFGSQPFNGQPFNGQPFDGQNFDGQHLDQSAGGTDAFGVSGAAGQPAGGTLLADPTAFGGEASQQGLHPAFGGAPTITPGSAFEPAPVFGVDSDLLVDEPSGRGRRRRKAKGRRSDVDGSAAEAPRSGGGSRRAVALLGIAAILGGAGYIGYTQLGGSQDDLVASPPGTRAAAGGAAAAKYPTPKQLSSYTQIGADESATLTRGYTGLVKAQFPGLPAPAVVTAYRPATSGDPTVNVVVYAPSARNDAAYNQIVEQLSRPGEGSVSVPAVPVAPGASGGTMLCGSQRGAANSAWCAWKSDKGVGFLQTRGTSNQNNAATFTRELRAFAER